MLGSQHAHAAPCVALGSAISDARKAKFALLPTGDPMPYCVCRHDIEKGHPAAAVAAAAVAMGSVAPSDRASA